MVAPIPNVSTTTTTVVKPRLAGKAAKRVTEIAAQGVEPGPAVQRVELFELDPRIAEFDPRLAAGLFGGTPRSIRSSA